MYTRSFYDTANIVPEGYDGEALREDDNTKKYTIQPTTIPEKVSPGTQEYNEAAEEEEESASAFSFGGILSPFMEKIPFKRFFESLGFEKFTKFDFEDIILIGVALVLFFSECGDKTLALMLIGLLFIAKE